MKKPRPLQVELPTAAEDRPSWRRLGIVGAVGLIIGLAWPRLTGMRLAPVVPGADKAALSAASEEPLPPGTTAAEPAPTGSGAVVPAKAGPGAADNSANQQLVVVAEGTVEKCWNGKDALDAAECGPLRVDSVLTPRLRQLSSCPSALGLSGELQIGFDIDFEKKALRVLRGKKSEIPSSTVAGILSCAADYVRDVSTEEIKHNQSKYRVFYTLRFYPPGARPSTEPAEQQQDKNAPADGQEGDSARGAATVAWDSVIVRDEPRTGKIVVRLVRGTRVTLISKRQDWYRIRVRTDEGWVYRGALGL